MSAEPIEPAPKGVTTHPIEPTEHTLPRSAIASIVTLGDLAEVGPRARQVVEPPEGN